MIVGLTGRIATGKTTVAAILEELGATIINADEIARELARPGSEVLEEIVKEFGPGFLECDGTLNRKKLGERVFGDAGALERLNGVFHPRLRREISERLKEMGREPCERPVVVEAAVLFEMGADSLVDKVVVTDCAPETQVKRLLERGLGREEAEARVDSQMSREEFLRRADVVIGTGGSLAETKQQVLTVWRGHLPECQGQGAAQQ